MSTETCAYVARKDEPKGWHGTDPSDFYLDRQWLFGGLGVTEWRCPHPPLDRDDADNQYCVFHTDPEKLPNEIDERDALLEALDDAGDGPWEDRPEHRGQFVGATFGPIDLSGEAIAATDDHDIRFDHARFRGDDGDLNFAGTTFETRGQYPLSFIRTAFTSDGGDVRFDEATFRTAGDGPLLFGTATFTTAGDGNVRFWAAAFSTAGDGDVWFGEATFKTDGEGHVWFGDATFRTDGDGDIRFNEASFGTAGDGNVLFRRATFTTAARGRVRFDEATFRTDGDGDVWFEGTTSRTVGDGDVWFGGATFKSAGDGDVGFINADLRNVKLQAVDLSDANLSGVDLTDTYLRGASVSDISVNGATTCERLHTEPDFDSGDWDATARAYHDLKTVFSEHGLIGKARKMHVQERHARSEEARAANGWCDMRYLGSFLSRYFTGYGVRVRNLLCWMLLLFLGSTAFYAAVGVEDTLVDTVSYSVLA